MSVKHTPGPWRVPHFARDDISCNCEYVLVAGYAGAVASVHYSTSDHIADGDNPPLEEAKANARIIAAAPDLLDACEALAAHVREKHNLSPETPFECEHMRAIDAAIAKAKGNAS